MVSSSSAALNTTDTDDDDGCSEKGEGVGTGGAKPEQVGTRKKKLSRERTLTICLISDERSGRL
jgi:hypothetical protein